MSTTFHNRLHNLLANSSTHVQEKSLKILTLSSITIQLDTVWLTGLRFNILLGTKLVILEKSVGGSTNDSLVDSHKWFMLLANINVYVSTHRKTYITNILNTELQCTNVPWYCWSSSTCSRSGSHSQRNIWSKQNLHTTKNTRRIFNTATLFHDTEIKTR